MSRCLNELKLYPGSRAGQTSRRGAASLFTGLACALLAGPFTSASAQLAMSVPLALPVPAASPDGALPVLHNRHAAMAAAVHGDFAAADFTSGPANEQFARLAIGRSVFVDTRHRLTRVYVTNPEVLDSYTASPNQIVVTAKKPGTSTVIVWDEAGESKTYVFSADVGIDGLKEALRQALPADSIQVRASEGRILLSGNVGTADAAELASKLAGTYSKDISNSIVVNAARVKQVRLEVRIVEIDRSKLNAFAFNFFSAGGNNLAGTSTQQFPTSLNVTTSGGGSGSSAGGKSVSVSDPLNFLFYSSRLNVGATLKDLETMQLLQILAEPNIVALSGTKANFLAGGEFPFPVVQGGAAGSAASVSIQFRPYGVKLEFTPIVNEDGTITLHVLPEVSALDYTNAVNISGYTVPALSTRRADTQVVLHSGQTFAISGLLDKRTTDQYSKTPGIASVPILGQLFKSKNVNHSTSELVVIVTPTVVDPLKDSTLPQEPQTVIPTLDHGSFDKSLPTPKAKH